MGEIYSRPYRTQEDLINALKERHLQSGRVEEAFRRVDRAHFMPEAERDNAYSDTAWRHEELHLSAPSIYATVLSYLEPQPGQSFLNLGSGTGYFSTIVGLLIGPHGVNHGVEVKPVVLEHAMNKVKEFRETAPEDYYTSFSVPEFFGGNFFSICPSSRRYDLIYCGAGISSKEELFSLRSLLNVNGRFIVPYRNALISVTLTSENKFVTNNLMSVAFSQAIPPSIESPDCSIVLPSPKPESLLRLASIIIRRRVANRMLEERGRPGMRVIAYSRPPEPRPPPRRLPHPQPPGSNDDGGGARLRPLLLSDVDTDEDEDDDDDDDDDDEDDDESHGIGVGVGADDEDDEDDPHGPGGGGGGERNALGPDMHRLYLFLRSLHTQEVAFSLASAEERMNAQLARQAQAEEEEAREVEGEGVAEAEAKKAEEETEAELEAETEADGKAENGAELDAKALADAAAVALEDALAKAETPADAMAAVTPLRSCKRGLDSGDSSNSSSDSSNGGGGGDGERHGISRRWVPCVRRDAESGEAAKKSRRGDGPSSAWVMPAEQPVEMDIELEEGSLSLRLSNEEARSKEAELLLKRLEDVRQNFLNNSTSPTAPNVAGSSVSGSECAAGRVRRASSSSGSTEGPDERPPDGISGATREVLAEPRYDSQAEIRSRFEQLPLPAPLKQYLMMSH